jgi:hypothetical protein
MFKYKLRLMTGETELMEDDGISVEERDREFEEEFSDEWS